MKQEFVTKRFGEGRLLLIQQAEEICDQYDADGIQLTLRQLYYQFVSRNWLANTEPNYKNLGDVISEARLAGLIDWSAIEDLGRVPSIPYNDTNLESFINGVREQADSYTLDRWLGQEYYLELHVEKQALSSVLGPIADEWGIGFSMNKGYASQTSFYDASKRFIQQARSGKKCVCLYAGDHDPSGLDMIRDFRDRMKIFGAPVTVKPIALTRAQVRQYRCPPNPARMTDARAEAYVAIHGRQSWEIDALDPKVLRKIAEKAIRAHADEDQMAAILKRQEAERLVIADALEEISPR